ncbi:MAG: HPr family phosphocarrier protein [Firmicutes bacterium]|nr:HPr family phosphocarrier protein [Bacillota bacterium]
MTEKKITVTLEEGLESRQAAIFVQVANKYASHIYLILEDRRVNAKSIMGIISLGMLKDEEVILQADGPDEAEAVEELSGMIG